MLTGYVIHPDYKKELFNELSGNELSNNELSKIEFETENIFWTRSNLNSIWAMDVFRDVQIAEFESIKKASDLLRSEGLFWFNCSQSHHRRSQLIQENLRTPKHSQLEFNQTIKKSGVWGLLGQNKLFFTHQTENLVSGGKILFQEDKVTPPSRAYLKLWELITVYKIRPLSTDNVLDMGSCPGGWSWVLSQICNQVISVDKAPLAPNISRISNIRFLQKDAFKLDPNEVPRCQWFFSDIICEPDRLLDLIKKWDHHVDNFVCTVKLKGETDFLAIKKFQELEPNLIKHLYNNKHEVTFVKLKK